MHWTHQPIDHNNSIVGASGSAVVLSAKLRDATGYVAVAFASGTMWGTRSEDLQGWERAVSKSGSKLFNYSGTPAGFGPNGDNNAWLAHDDDGQDRVYYLAAGVHRDSDGAVDAAALYRSTSNDLSTFENVTEFYTGSAMDYAGIGVNCPDVWRNVSGDLNTTVLMWLQHPPWHRPWDTAWTVGTQASSTSAPTWAGTSQSDYRPFFCVHKNDELLASLHNATGRGLVDNSAAFIAAQSFNDVNDRRVIFAWVSTPANPIFVGLQTFPRELWLDAHSKKLHSRPIEEISKLRTSPKRHGRAVLSTESDSRSCDANKTLVGLEGHHSYQLLLNLKLSNMPVGAEAGVTLFDGAGKHPGLNVVLAQPSCAYSAE